MTTIIIGCPACGFENLSGALVCAQCNSLLVKLEDQTFNTTLTPPVPNGAVGDRSILRSVTDRPALDANSLALYIGGRTTPLIVVVIQPLLLGRTSKDGNVQPQVDLTPYGGYEKGISRRHAVIRRTENGLVVEDLDSANGSWLNGESLQAYTPTLLEPDDVLKLGKLEILLYFPSP